MAEFDNPFTPAFGEVPDYFAGRTELLNAMGRAFSSERRRPELTTVLSGARGTGKTTLLSMLGDLAAQRGWIVVNVMCEESMLDDIEVQTRRSAEHVLPSEKSMHVTKIGMPQLVEISVSDSALQAENWRSRMEDIIASLNAQGIGLLITVDEVDPGQEGMIRLASVYQLFVREQRRVGLVMAGLPSKVSSLLSDGTVSFLRRSSIAKLDRIADQDVESAFRKSIEANGRTIASSDLDLAIDAVKGFPFLMQLVGYRMWDEHPSEVDISHADVERGIALARDDLNTRVFDATFRELSSGDIDFLVAMLEDEGDSAIADIVTRTGKSPSLASQHRKRLIEAGVIGSRRRGVVGFDLPFFREYLAEQVA